MGVIIQRPTLQSSLSSGVNSSVEADGGRQIFTTPPLGFPGSFHLLCIYATEGSGIIKLAERGILQDWKQEGEEKTREKV